MSRCEKSRDFCKTTQKSMTMAIHKAILINKTDNFTAFFILTHHKSTSLSQIAKPF